MKIIFLDVDGVLNADDTYMFIDGPKKGKHKSNSPTCCGYTGIDRAKVKRLQQIIEATDAKIVLVSSWKECYEYFTGNPTVEENSDLSATTLRAMGKYLHNKLSEFHLHIYDTTYEDEKVTRGFRGEGIAHWLSRHSKEDVESWIALDDEIWGYLDEQKDHVIQTDPYLGFYDKTNWGPRGLTDVEVKKAIDLLNGNVTEEK